MNLKRFHKCKMSFYMIALFSQETRLKALSKEIADMQSHLKELTENQENHDKEISKLY